MKHMAVLTAFLLCLMLLFFSQPAMQAAQNALNLWWNTLLPTLFPFFVSATIIERTGGLHSLAKVLYPLTKKLKTSHYSLPVLIFGGISGYPSGARLCGMLLSSGALTANEAEQLGTVCNLCSPMFLLGFVANSLFKNASLFVPIAFSHYFAALLVAVLYKILWTQTYSRPSNTYSESKTSFLEALPKAIADGMSDMLKVGGSVMFFFVLAEIFKYLGLFEILGLPIDNLFANASGSSKCSPSYGLLLGIMEITGGCYYISKLCLPVQTAVPLCTFIISFGGLSTMVQAMAFIQFKRPIRYICIKLVHGLIGGLLAHLYFVLFKHSAPAFLASQEASPYLINALTGLSLLTASSIGIAFAMLLGIVSKRLCKHIAPKH